MFPRVCCVVAAVATGMEVTAVELTIRRLCTVRTVSAWILRILELRGKDDLTEDSVLAPNCGDFVALLQFQTAFSGGSQVGFPLGSIRTPIWIPFRFPNQGRCCVVLIVGRGITFVKVSKYFF